MKKTATRKNRKAPVTVSPSLSPQAKTVLKHILKAGSITLREAMMDHSVQSLPRRIKDLREAGYNIVGSWKLHPITGQRYMRYALED